MVSTSSDMPARDYFLRHSGLVRRVTTKRLVHAPIRGRRTDAAKVEDQARAALFGGYDSALCMAPQRSSTTRFSPALNPFVSSELDGLRRRTQRGGRSSRRAGAIHLAILQVFNCRE